MNIYIYTGDDTFSIQEQKDKLINQLVDPDWQELNLDLFEGDTIDSGKIIDACLALPFYGEQRLVIVTYHRQKEALYELAEKILNVDSPNTLLLISPDLDKRKKAVKQLLSVAKHKAFTQTKVWNVQKELYPWLDEQVRREDKRIARDAMDQLVLCVGVDKNVLKNTLNKLLTYIDSGSIIEKTHVQLLVKNTESNIFQFLETLAKLQNDLALIQLNNLLLFEPPQKIIATLASSLRNIFRMKRLQAQRMSVNDIAKTLHLNPYITKKNMHLWNQFSISDLELRVRRLLAIDTLSKKSQLSSKLGLEMWVCEWMNQPLKQSA